MKSGKQIGGIEWYALAFGLFLGLTIWKFGNPVILDQKIFPPRSLSEFWNDPWPTHWANWILLPLAMIGTFLVFAKRPRWPETKWLWLLPLLWFGWQLCAATRTVDASLTAVTLWEFFGCGVCFFLGAFVLGRERARHWLLAGVLAAFTFCLVKAIDQHVFEFPQSRQSLIEGERAGWSNIPPEIFVEMKREHVVIPANGVDVANPAILAKFAKGRAYGTLVYPNALAGMILLLFPLSLVLVFDRTKRLRPAIRALVIALALFLGSAGFFWTGSKLGWLIAIAMSCLWLFRLRWPARLKWVVFAVILLMGLGIFAVRFHNYFAAGATSVGARFDYWRAAAQTARTHPLLGTGPGTFQRSYAQLKAPDAEMARLTHNDYLEQFSDSGIAGGIFYAAWIFLALTLIGRRVWQSSDPVTFALFTGVLGWFAQGLGEFSLYIPALAWTAFTLLGCLLTPPRNQIDKPREIN
jgi:hypothetical protein